MNKIPEEIRDYLGYNEITGNLYWIKKPNSRINIETIAGTLHKEGYLKIGFRRKIYLAHRIAWFIKTGEQPNEIIDHKDTNKTNNKWENLRKATKSQNEHNTQKQKNNTSGYKGVSWHKPSNKWAANIRLNTKLHHLGYYLSPEEAHAAYCTASVKLHGEFSNIG